MPTLLRYFCNCLGFLAVKPFGVCLSSRISEFRVICPASGVSNKLRHRKNVLLPEPDEPKRDMTSPLCKDREIPLRISKLPKDLCRPCTSNTSALFF